MGVRVGTGEEVRAELQGRHVLGLLWREIPCNEKPQLRAHAAAGGAPKLGHFPRDRTDIKNLCSEQAP